MQLSVRLAGGRGKGYSGGNDFGLRPRGALGSRSAASLAFGQTLYLKPLPVSSYPCEAHQALASPNFMFLFLLRWEARALIAPVSSPPVGFVDAERSPLPNTR